MPAEHHEGRPEHHEGRRRGRLARDVRPDSIFPRLSHNVAAQVHASKSSIGVGTPHRHMKDASSTCNILEWSEDVDVATQVTPKDIDNAAWEALAPLLRRVEASRSGSTHLGL